MPSSTGLKQILKLVGTSMHLLPAFGRHQGKCGRVTTRAPRGINVEIEQQTQRLLTLDGKAMLKIQPFSHSHSLNLAKQGTSNFLKINEFLGSAVALVVFRTRARHFLPKTQSISSQDGANAIMITTTCKCSRAQGSCTCTTRGLCEQSLLNSCPRPLLSPVGRLLFRQGRAVLRSGRVWTQIVSPRPRA